MKTTGTFVILLSQNGFESDCPENFQTMTSYSHFEKVALQKSISELRTIIWNQMNKYQFPNKRIDQINDHKHDIYLYGKLSTILIRPKKVFRKSAGWKFLSLTRPHNWMCIRIYILNFEKKRRKENIRISVKKKREYPWKI